MGHVSPDAVLGAVHARGQALPEVRFAVVHREIQVGGAPARRGHIRGGVLVAHLGGGVKGRVGHGLEGDIGEAPQRAVVGGHGREFGEQREGDPRGLIQHPRRNLQTEGLQAHLTPGGVQRIAQETFVGAGCAGGAGRKAQGLFFTHGAGLLVGVLHAGIAAVVFDPNGG